MARERRTIYFELLVTVGLFVLPHVLAAVYQFLHPADPVVRPQDASWHFISLLVTELLMLGLLAHLLRVNGESLADLTMPFEGRDLLRGTGLAFLAYAAYYGAAWILMSLAGGFHEPSRKSMEVFNAPFSVWYLLVAIVNPFAEEFFVRGFLQTRLRQAGHDGLNVVLFSVAVQASYHLYQGALPCLSLAFCFLIFALYYQAKRRLWPVVIAHLIMDVLAMLAYMKR